MNFLCSPATREVTSRSFAIVARSGLELNLTPCLQVQKCSSLTGGGWRSSLWSFWLAWRRKDYPRLSNQHPMQLLPGGGLPCPRNTSGTRGVQFTQKSPKVAMSSRQPPTTSLDKLPHHDKMASRLFLVLSASLSSPPLTSTT